MADAPIDRRFEDAARTFGISLTLRQRDCFARYLRLMMEAPHNVTALDDPREIVEGLFVDALAAAPLMRGIEGPAVDVGSGGGIPGLPLAIVDPSRGFLLVDSNGKKVGFIHRVIEALQLDNARVRQTRVEELGRASGTREWFGVAMAKALSSLRVLVEWLVPLVCPAGRVLCWKGPNVTSEIEEAHAALTALGAEVEEVRAYEIAGRGRRNIVVVRRVAPLSAVYPRRVGVALKRPL